jgi:hypothetical protein
MTTLGILLLAGALGLPEDPAGLPVPIGGAGLRAPGEHAVNGAEPEEPPIVEPATVIPADDMLEILVHLEHAKRVIRKQEEKRLAVLLDRAIAVGRLPCELEAGHADLDDPVMASLFLEGWLKRDRVIRRLIEAEAELDEQQAALMLRFNNQPMFRVVPPLDEGSWRDRVSERMKADQAAERPPPDSKTKTRTWGPTSSNRSRHQGPCKRRRIS